MVDAATMVVYLAGAREFHWPEETLGCVGELDEQVRAAAELPLADPPGRMPASVVPGHVHLLRLDRVAQSLEAIRNPKPLGFVFILTDQRDPNFGTKDTSQLTDVLRRWCEARGFVCAQEVLTQAPNRLDGGGQELIAKLDRRFTTAERIVLVSSGGPSALQIAAHFAAFQGTRHREDVTILQLEEVRLTNAEDPVSSRNPVDTKVIPIQKFQRVVGQRAIEHQAAEALDRLDLQGASQLIQAARSSGLCDQSTESLAEELLKGLARQEVLPNQLEQLRGALSLAEVEWSRMAGNRAEALWYAGLAIVDLLAPAWAVANDRGNELHIRPTKRLVESFNDAARHPSKRDDWANIRMDARPLANALPILSGGPETLEFPDRSIPLSTILGSRFTGQSTGQALIWLALLVTFKPLRNDHAHELIGLTLDDAHRRMQDLSEGFLKRMEYLEPGSQERPNGRILIEGITQEASCALDLTVSLECQESALRKIIRGVIPDVGDRNPLLGVASQLREHLLT